MHNHILNKGEFERWLSKAQLFRGANAGRYQLIDGRSLHVTRQEADKDRALFWYEFKLGGVHKVSGPDRWTQSHIVLRFKTSAMGSSEGLCDPVASILIEESTSVPLSHKHPGPLGGQVPLGWEMDGDSPVRRALARTERVVFEAIVEEILDAVKTCMVPEGTIL